MNSTISNVGSLPSICDVTLFQQSKTYDLHCSRRDCLEGCFNDANFSANIYLIGVLVFGLLYISTFCARKCIDKYTLSNRQIRVIALNDEVEKDEGEAATSAKKEISINENEFNQLIKPDPQRNIMKQLERSLLFSTSFFICMSTIVRLFAFMAYSGLNTACERACMQITD